MDVIARQPVASAYTQAQQIAPRLFRIPKSGCPDIWIRLPKHKWPPWSSMDDSVVPLEWNLYRHHSLDYWKHSSRKMTGKTGNWDGKITELAMCTCWPKTMIMFIGTRRWHENCWKNMMLLPCGRKNEKCWSWRTRFISWSFFWDALNANPAAVRTQRECAPNAYREINVRITNFCWGNWKIDFQCKQTKLHAWKDVLKNA